MKYQKRLVSIRNSLSSCIICWHGISGWVASSLAVLFVRAPVVICNGHLVPIIDSVTYQLDISSLHIRTCLTFILGFRALRSVVRHAKIAVHFYCPAEAIWAGWEIIASCYTCRCKWLSQNSRDLSLVVHLWMNKQHTHRQAGKCAWKTGSLKYRHYMVATLEIIMCRPLFYSFFCSTRLE